MGDSSSRSLSLSLYSFPNSLVLALAPFARFARLLRLISVGSCLSVWPRLVGLGYLMCAADLYVCLPVCLSDWLAGWISILLRPRLRGGGVRFLIFNSSGSPVRASLSLDSKSHICNAFRVGGQRQYHAMPFAVVKVLV